MVLKLSLKTWLWILGAAVILGGGYFVFHKSAPKTELVKAKMRDVVDVVTVTGSIEPATSINLEFLSSGKVVYRPVWVGSQVSASQVLMSLDGRDINLQIQKAEAVQEGNQAKLDQLKAGATSGTVAQLENALAASYEEALVALDTALTKADKAFTILRSDVYTQTNTVRTDFQLQLDSSVAKAQNDKNAADAAEADVRSMRDVAAVSIAGPNPSGNLNVDLFFQKAPAELNAVSQSLVSSVALLRAVISPTVSQSTVSGYLTDIAGVQSELNTAMTSLTDAVAAIQSAKDALRVKIEPPRAVDLAVLEANVNSATADVAILKEQKSDLSLVAPVGGTVTALNYEIGEIARPSITAVSLISRGGFEVEANVPEVDIAKVALADRVKITFDSLPGETFDGKVTHIDPAETVVSGVTNYKIKVALEIKDNRIKSGGTANLAIETLRKPHVLTLPQFGIIERDDGTFVHKIVNGKEEEVKITTGIRSSDGYVEILSGLQEGEAVVNVGVKTH